MTFGHAHAHDRDLALEVGVLDPVVEAATLQRVVHVAGAVGREHDDRGPVVVNLPSSGMVIW